VTYGDNNKEKIIGRDTIGDKNTFLFHDVLFVEGLKNMLKMVAAPFKIVFDEDLYVVFDEDLYVILMYFLLCFKYVLVSA